MKNLNYLLLGAAGLLLASCSQEELVTPAPAGDGNFNITVSLPGSYSSRTMNDGYTATELYVGVFDADNDNAFVYQVPSDGFADDQLTTQVSMNLATGKTYTIAFFAYAPGAFSTDGTSALYSLDQETGVMTVDYSLMDQDGIDTDTYDCFFNVINTGTISNKAETVNVTLTRPLAQVNWGTDDADAEAVMNDNAYGEDLEYLKAELTTSAYSQFSFIEGDVVDDSETSVTLNGFAVPAGTSYPVNPTTYTYVAMQYLLAPVATSATYDLTLNVDNSGNASASQLSNEIVVSSAPVQANYQTNIYGTLLSDKYNFNVTKSPGWAGDFKLPQNTGDQVTDDNGQVVDGLYLNSETKTYTITSPEGLEYYATKIAGTGQYTMGGYLTVLGADLDMSGTVHTPFSAGNGTFDGQGHTISNLTVNAPSTAGKEVYAGFMSSAIGTVQNINFQGAKITGNSWAGVLAGDGIAAEVNNVNAYNCTVTSTAYINSEGEYEAGNSVGGIIGYLSAQGSASVTNCTVDGCTITGCRDVGGVVGRAQYTDAIVENNTVTNTTVTVNQYIKGGTYSETNKGTYGGEVVGNLLSDPTVKNNTTNNVNVLYIDGTGAYAVSSLPELQAVFNLGQKALASNTITMSAPNMEIDLGGATIDPISFAGDNEYSTDFGLTFDGKGLTIKNFTVKYHENANRRCGLFYAFAGTFKNLTVENMTIETPSKISGASLIAYCGGGTISNVTVKNSNITNILDSATAASAIVGLTYGVTVEDCVVENCNIKSARRAGAIIGYCGGPSTISGCTVTDTNVTATETPGSAQILAGNYDGTSLAPVTYSGNTVTNCTVNGEPATNPQNN